MEEKEEIKFPKELFGENLTEELKADLTSKLIQISEADEDKIDDYYKYYLSGMAYLHKLVISRLDTETATRFWEQVNTEDLIFRINSIESFTKVIKKYIISLEPKVEALHLIIKNYFKMTLNNLK